MNSDRKQRLLTLAPDRLADALLELATRDDAADDLVERMIATPQENIERFRKKLAAIKRSRRFIRWGESAAFTRELIALLQDLQAGVSDPRTGAELVTSATRGRWATATIPAAMWAMSSGTMPGSSLSATPPVATRRNGWGIWCTR